MREDFGEVSLTPRFSEVDQLQHHPSSCFNSFSANRTKSEYIRVTFVAQPALTVNNGN
jgi:hypothetical protein